MKLTHRGAYISHENEKNCNDRIYKGQKALGRSRIANRGRGHLTRGRHSDEGAPLLAGKTIKRAPNPFGGR